MAAVPVAMVIGVSGGVVIAATAAIVAMETTAETAIIAAMTATTAGFDTQLRRFEMRTVWDRS